MSTSPDLGIPYIASSQSQPEVTHNTAMNLIQMLCNGVIDKDLNTAPGSPSEGDVYIVGTSPTGAWAGRANSLAGFFGGAWTYLPGNNSSGTPITIGPRNAGLFVYVRDEELFYVWNGTSWSSTGLSPLVSG